MNVRDFFSKTLAMGLGLGKCVPAPGTWGSLLGLVVGWFVSRSLSAWVLIAWLIVSFVLSAWICTRAEQLLARQDPPMVVLDEVWGMMAIVSCLPWLTASIKALLGAFLAFRIFDILKPFPLKRLARLPAGWGIMADDCGAAFYTIVLLQWLRGYLIVG